VTRHVAPADPLADTPASAFARVYNYLLGGAVSTGADRMAGDRLLDLDPWMARRALLGRCFLRHALTVMSAAGIGQFLDLGSGLPTAGNSHEILASIAPAARVVYVDVAPITVRIGRRLLQDAPHTAVVCADLREADRVIRLAAQTGLLDPSQPVGLLVVEVAHHLPDPLGDVLGGYRARLAPGSCVALTHRVPNDSDRDLSVMAEIRMLCGLPNIARTPQEISALMAGLALRAPSRLVPVVDHLARLGHGPDSGAPSPAERALLGAIGHLPPVGEHGLPPPTAAL
jgi:O-methyltransferase involved in polyketide biosynthesis